MLAGKTQRARTVAYEGKRYRIVIGRFATAGIDKRTSEKNDVVRYMRQRATVA